ncbi:NAD(P)/FAD-dependent oxidoreductase [Brevundimonas sp.]|uniref:NAD(P)/FAD-dependent oxidoreductase n=1 Tax=Brevundimonas sp. TaxID=1871086 RepID=UPI00272F3E77|nr:NAD(P)/FAD-dependent oxidoreductase [Brevundimonas sp.]MDP1912226.1 NAD(P)/FAD-dependent oxidoreductase [Brevundimonas sp.]
MLPPTLPQACDVLVVGAGPAGSACAHHLAAGGLDVVLADQHDFPRDKVCGDGLIPDAHAALRRLGVYDEVAALAMHVPHVRCVGPRGGHVDVPGTLSVLPRKVLDHVLVRAAQRAGARLLTPLRFEAPLLEGERVVGARLRSGEATHEIAAHWVVLATGAAPGPLTAAGLCERHTPSGVALRGYVRNEAMGERIQQLQLVWHPRLRGGYGWIFPAPGGLFNIGAGLTGSHITQRNGKGRMQDVNLRRMFADFCAVYAPAAELMAGGELQGELKGAPLRCSLQGARWSRPGLLGVGEVVGSTYAFSGEGIGKAMETGLLAAEAVLADGGGPEAAVRQRYEAGLRGLQPKFDLYETASRVNQYPWLADLVVWRGRRSARILRRLSGVLEETQNPGRLFTWRGLTKLLFE